MKYVQGHIMKKCLIRGGEGLGGGRDPNKVWIRMERRRVGDPNEVLLR